MAGTEYRLTKWQTVALGLTYPYGIYLFFSNLWYFVHVWKSLHSQGMSHLYLAICTVAGSWWLSVCAVLCFAASIIASKPGRYYPLKLVLGLVLAWFASQLGIVSYFTVVALVRGWIN
jgi:hypothetical protein